MSRLCIILGTALLLVSCHLDIFLGNTPAPCKTDDNCPNDQVCHNQRCLKSAPRDGGSGDGQVVDTATVADTRIADTPPPDSPQPDAQTADTAVGPDRASPPDAGGFDTLFVAGENNPQFMVHNQGYIYWTSYSASGPIRRIATGGGGAETVTSCPSSNHFPYSIAVDDTNVYFVAAGNHLASNEDNIYLAPKGVLQSTTLLASGQHAVGDSSSIGPIGNGLYSDNSSVYWLIKGAALNKNLVRYQLDNQSTVAASTQESVPRGLVKTENHIYLVEGGMPPGRVKRADLGFAASDDLTFVNDIGENVFASAANSSHLFWSVDAKVTGDAGKIVAVTFAGNITTLLDQVGEQSNVSVWDLEADDSYLYYTADTGRDSSTSGRVYRVSLTEPNPSREILATGVEPAGIAIDDNYVYWTDYAAGEIRRLPK